MKLARGLKSQDEPPSWNARELVFLPRRHFSNNPLFMASFPAAAPAVSPNGTGVQRAHLDGRATSSSISNGNLATASFPPSFIRATEWSERREGQVRVSGHISPSVPRMIVCCPAARAQAAGAGGHESGKCRSYSNPEFPFQLPAGASFVILNCGADSSDSLPPLSPLGRSLSQPRSRSLPNNGALASG